MDPSQPNQTMLDTWTQESTRNQGADESARLGTKIFSAEETEALCTHCKLKMLKDTIVGTIRENITSNGLIRITGSIMTQN